MTTAKKLKIGIENWGQIQKPLTFIFAHGSCDLSILADCCASTRSQRLTLQAAPMN
jgi:hypothetical protein